jgi:DNA-binding NarL/FixJ family response regulator
VAFGEGAVATEKGCILVVDDDAELRALLAELLEHRGYRVREAGRGEHALATARQERPDLVLLDVNLPGMSGYDVCRELRAAFGEHLPILFISGERTEPFDRVAGLRLGADDYIVKPFAPDALLARVDRFVDHAPHAEDEQEPAPASPSRLTKRELEVLQLLADGRRPKEIGRELAVSRKTVSSHIQNILIKLDVHSQAQAVAVAYRSGLIDVPEETLRRWSGS